MAEKNIVLIGFMGCGKSLTSSKLAEILDRQVISTDKLVEKKEGQSVAEIFEKSGEGYFRRVEKEIIKEISDQSGMIIDCGGGVVMDDENMANLKKNGHVIYLSASPESIYNNIKNRSHRPGSTERRSHRPLWLLATRRNRGRCSSTSHLRRTCPRGRRTSSSGAKRHR